MGIFLFHKNKLRCPKCGGLYDKTDALTKTLNYTCFECACKLITEDEYQSSGYHSDKPVIECPYCHSTDTKKISGISKAGSVALFGVFAAGKVSKQWHCNNCSSDF